MSDAKIALLPDRGVVSVTGEDARKLLGGIITNSLDGLPLSPAAAGIPQAIHAGLLSPQGKILFEFFVVAWGDGLLLDVAAERAGDLVKRLTLYKLRAKALIKDESALIAVVAVWDGAPPFSLPATHYVDPRDVGLGARWLPPRAMIEQLVAASARGETAFHAYHTHRIALGIPEGGKDYEFGDAFPHEANFDLLDGVSFEKGCYVGQEIVARMEHRGTVRKRIVRVAGASELPATRPNVKIGDVVIGRLGSVAGRMGLAMLRLDRAIEAVDKGEPITADGIALEVDAAMLARQRKVMADKAASA